LFLYAFDADFFQGLPQNKQKIGPELWFQVPLYRWCSVTEHSRFGDYLHGIYPNELEAKYTTASQKSASFLDLYLEIDNGGRLKKQNSTTNASTWVRPGIFGGVRVGHMFSFLCCPIMCLYVLICVLWCPHTNDVRFVFTSSCL
jgi:hypothetical protein